MSPALSAAASRLNSSHRKQHRNKPRTAATSNFPKRFANGSLRVVVASLLSTPAALKTGRSVHSAKLISYQSTAFSVLNL